MSELIKKYYIEVNYGRSVDFGIVYGTVTAKNFNVKERDSIVGSTFDTRISLTNKSLFDDFKDASKKYFELVKFCQERLMDDFNELEQEKSKVTELVKMVESE